MVSALINLANMKLVPNPSAALDLADTLIDLAIGGTLLTLSFTVLFREYWRSITWLGCALVIANDGVTGARHGEIVMFLVTTMLIMMGTGALSSLVCAMAGLIQHSLRRGMVGNAVERRAAR